MNSTEEITAFINALRGLNGVGVCYYDLNSFFNYDRYGVKNNRGHYCAFCERTRALPTGRANCERSDRHEAVELARQYREPFFYKCHMGMRELVIPLMRDEALIGVLFVGQCRSEGNDANEIRENAIRMNGDPEEFSALYARLPLIPQKDILNMGKLLLQYFQVKILNNELLGSHSGFVSANFDLPQAIHDFIQANYRHRLSLSEIAGEFHVNASYASRCFSQRYHMTITAYITTVRMERAKMFLLSTDASVSNIALNVGIDDANYFSRVFRKMMGCSPGQYRSRNR